MTISFLFPLQVNIYGKIWFPPVSGNRNTGNCRENPVSGNGTLGNTSKFPVSGNGNTSGNGNDSNTGNIRKNPVSENGNHFISFSSSDAEYFAKANLNSLEDVAAAIDACKKSILETTENTVSRKAMVNRLIQLQIRQEDLKERQALSATTFETRGHTFVNYTHDIKIPGTVIPRYSVPRYSDFFAADQFLMY